MKRAVTTCGIALGTLASVALVATPASAKVKTHMIISHAGTPVTATIELTNVNNTYVVDATMDDDCVQAFQGHNQSFGIAVGNDLPAVATVDPTSVAGGLQCDDSQSFTIHAVGDGTTTLRFDPVTNAPGLQNQMAGQSVTVHVTGFGTVDPPEDPPGHHRPAAPAVANAYVVHGSSKAESCQDAYGGVKSWHGKLLHEIAQWARDEKKLGNGKQTFPSDDAWISFVQDKVDELCS